MTPTIYPHADTLVNPYVDYRGIGYRGGVNSALQRLFVKRLQEEMRARKLSANALSRICKSRGLVVGYASISRILAGKQDPTLEKVEALSEAVGMPAWALLTQADQLEQRVIRPAPSNVVKLPDPYPKIFGPRPETPATRKAKRK